VSGESRTKLFRRHRRLQFLDPLKIVAEQR
jgi:hypothetical protein